MLNPYFNNYFYSNTQNLLNDLCIEAIQQKGADVVYMPRTIIDYDKVLGEGEHYSFNDSITIEMYLNNFEQWGGQGDLMSKFGIQITDQAELIVSRTRFEKELKDLRVVPQEADMIYFPISKSFFTIKHVDYDSEFWPHGNNYIYSLKVELTDYSGETMNVSNTEVIEEISTFPVSSNATFIPDDTDEFIENEYVYINKSEDNPYDF